MMVSRSGTLGAAFRRGSRPCLRDRFDPAPLFVVPHDDSSRVQHLAETVQRILRDAEADGLTQGHPGPMPTPGSVWILVVEDDRRLQDLWTVALSRAGYTVLGCEDGATAVEMVRDFIPHLVLLDLRVPRLSGATVLEALRRHPVWNRIPIMIVSGHLEDEPRLESGTIPRIVDRIQKPVSLDVLLQRVRAALASVEPGSEQS